MVGGLKRRRTNDGYRCGLRRACEFELALNFFSEKSEKYESLLSSFKGAQNRCKINVQIVTILWKTECSKDPKNVLVLRGSVSMFVFAVPSSYGWLDFRFPLIPAY